MTGTTSGTVERLAAQLGVNAYGEPAATLRAPPAARRARRAALEEIIKRDKRIADLRNGDGDVYCVDGPLAAFCRQKLEALRHDH
jgi:hypothetical protein